MKYFTKLMLVLLWCIVGTTGAYADFVLDQKITNLADLADKKFAIVDEASEKALYCSGKSDNWRIELGDYATAFSSSNAAIQFRMQTVDGVEGGYMFHAVAPNGNDYDPNGDGWFQTNLPVDKENGVCFVIWPNCDGENAHVWILEEGTGDNEGTFRFKNAATELYMNTSEATARFSEDDAIYWSFYTLKDDGTVPPADFSLDTQLTSLDDLAGKDFAIVNETEGKAIWVSGGAYGFDISYDAYATAFKNENKAIAFRLATQDDYTLIQSITPGFQPYQSWFGIGYLNSGNWSSFVGMIGNDHILGQDYDYGAAWVIEEGDGENEGKFALKNVGTDQYFYGTAKANSETPVYWSFYTLKEYGFNGNLIFNGDLEDDCTYSFITKEKGGAIKNATIVDGIGPDGSRALKLETNANPKKIDPETGEQAKDGNGNPLWELVEHDTQFFIKFAKALPEGTKVKVTFDYKATNECTIGTQAQYNPGQYQHWMCLGNVGFTEEWQTFKSTIVVSKEMAGAKGLLSVAFNMTPHDIEATTYYLDNFTAVVITKDEDEASEISNNTDNVEEEAYALSEALNDAKKKLDDAVYTTETYKAFIDAIAAGEAGMVNGDADLYELRNDVNQAVANLEERESFYSPLTKDMFFEWDGVGADAKQKSAATSEKCIVQKIGQGTLVYGNGNVSCKHYADLSDNMRLIIEGTPGMKLRVLLNRPEKLDGDNIPGNDNNGGPVDERKVELDENGQAVVDLYDDVYAHLNAIKTDWGSPEGMITQIYLQKKSYLVQKDAEFLAKSTEASPEDGVIADAWSSADGNSLEPTKDVEKAVAIWQDAEGNVDLRVAKDGAFIVGGPSSSEAIVKVVLEGAAISLTPSDGAWANQAAAAAARADEEPAAEEEAAPTRMVWVGNIDKVKFWADDLTRLSKITVVTAEADGNTQAYEDKARPAGAPVADIASFNALEEGKVAILKLNKAVVLATSEKNVVLEDNSGNLMLYNMGIEVEVGDSLSGELAGKHTIYKGMPEMTKDESTDVTKVTKVAGPAPEAKAVTLAELKAEANILKLVVISKAVIDSVDNKCFAKIEEESVQIYDTFGTRADWGIAKGNVYTTITGIVIPFKKDADTDMVFELAPRTAADLVLDADATGIRELNSVNLNGEVYNLQGQKMNGQLRKGLYIIDGKKVMVK